MITLSERIPKNLISFILFFAVIGFLDAAYLSAEHFAGNTPNCSFLRGCDLVTTSNYSTIWFIPLAYLGLGFYVALFSVATLVRELKSEKLLKYLFGLSIAGFAFSLWLTYLQAFVINAFCLFCVTSAATSTTIFVLSAIALKKTRD